MKLKELRLQYKKSQIEIAKIAQVSQSNYSKYELGKLVPDMNFMINLANYYNVSLDYICDRPFNNNIGYIPEEKRAIIKQIISFDSKKLSYLQGVIDTLAQHDKWS